MSQKSPTRIYGLIGYPVRHSLSPAMHNAAFKDLGINAEYRLFEVRPEQLSNFLLEDTVVEDTRGNTCSTREIAGLNITIPHKIEAKRIIEERFSDPSFLGSEQGYYVGFSGAINTVKFRKDGLEYYNTDAIGFRKSLKEDLHFSPDGKNIIVFGCGGAGRAIIAALTWRDVRCSKIFIFDVNKAIMQHVQNHFSRWPSLVNTLECITAEDVSAVIKKCDLLINASPIGMKDQDDSIVPRTLLHKALYVYDVIYHRETKLVQDARLKQLPVTDGLGMLLYQGVAAFELWADKAAPVDVMREALEKELEHARYTD